MTQFLLVAWGMCLALGWASAWRLSAVALDNLVLGFVLIEGLCRLVHTVLTGGSGSRSNRTAPPPRVVTPDPASYRVPPGCAPLPTDAAANRNAEDSAIAKLLGEAIQLNASGEKKDDSAFGAAALGQYASVLNVGLMISAKIVEVRLDRVSRPGLCSSLTTPRSSSMVCRCSTISAF